MYLQQKKATVLLYYPKLECSSQVDVFSFILTCYTK